MEVIEVSTVARGVKQRTCDILQLVVSNRYLMIVPSVFTTWGNCILNLKLLIKHSGAGDALLTVTELPKL